MIYSERDLEYLRGDRFKTRFDMKLSPNKLECRMDKLKKLCNEKSVIHIGCCDHLSVIDQKIQENVWLHGLLDECCRVLQGIDICKESVEYCNSKQLCKTPIICGDCTSVSVDAIETYEIVLMAEMIEHINNPVSFLEETYNNFKKQGFEGQYIVTAPNALGLIRRNIFKKSIERINTDHKYWFSPYTLAKIMMEAGITPYSCDFVQYGPCVDEEEVTYMSDSIIIIGR